MVSRVALFALVLSLASVLPAFAVDGYEKEYTPFPMIMGLDSLAIPFWGGVNAPKPTLVDFDRDGRMDLFLGDRNGKLSYLRNTGASDAPVFAPIADRLAGIDIGSWHILVDIDADSDLDLFCDSRTGAALFYRNESAGENLSFVLEDTAFGGFQTGVFNTPAFADLDHDNDLDFFFGGISGNLEFYRNDGDSAAPSFSLASTFYDSISAFPGGGGFKRPAEPQHGFSSICFADPDRDNDLDLFWGDINNFNLYYFVNRGDSAVSDLAYDTEDFLPSSTLGFNHTTAGDVDGDNDIDLLIGVGNGADINNLRLYSDTGTPGAPAYTLTNPDLLDNFDVGSYAIPAVGDLDGDGDFDMLVGRFDGHLSYFENTGTSNSPEFTLISDSLFGIDVGTNSAPELADWDNDGDLDLLLGTGLGRIELWLNQGDSTNFDIVLADAQLAGLKVDQYATPRWADMNEDNLPDLVVGEWDFNSLANVRLYRNTGTLSAPLLTLETSQLIASLPLTDFTMPYVYDWDNDSRPDLLLGGSGLGLVWWRNVSTDGEFPTSATLDPQVDALPGADDGYHIAVELCDIDGDGDDDVFAGEADGGLNFYRNTSLCCIGVTGNASGDSGELVDISDLTELVNNLFLTFEPLVCEDEGNVNGDAAGLIDITDITLLVNHLFLTFQPLPACP